LCLAVKIHKSVGKNERLVGKYCLNAYKNDPNKTPPKRTQSAPFSSFRRKRKISPEPNSKIEAQIQNLVENAMA